MSGGEPVDWMVPVHKLNCLNDAQLALMMKYPCYECVHFGYCFAYHRWVCELGLFQQGRSCSSFVLNEFLREDSCIGYFIDANGDAYVKRAAGPFDESLNHVFTDYAHAKMRGDGVEAARLADLINKGAGGSDK